MKPAWELWIDTGGTFTDGFARGPKGLQRTKVLSNGSLRGVVLEQVQPDIYRIAQQWRAEVSIFEGYTLRFPDMPGQQWRVLAMWTEAGDTFMRLDGMLGGLPLFFALSAGEEAPVLAARILTATPLSESLPPLTMRLGTTRGTNALLERKGARVCLITTQGLADLPAIGTQQRPSLFQLDIPEPVLLHAGVLEAPGRLSANGEELEPLEASAVHALTAAAAGAESVAVALLHSYRNPAHELRLAAALRAAGHRYVSVSAQLSPAIKLLPRLQTAVVNAYLEPVLDAYLSGIRAALGGSGLQVMTSAGGLVSVADFQAKDSLLSGPAGGVAGAAHIAARMGHRRILTLDMGGTSTDCARYDGRFDYRYTTQVGDASLQSPALDIATVAAGGGSVCYFDGKKLCVGPESAGADPGPACYGSGGPLTITDVNLLLGKLAPEAMGIPISRERAREALAAVRQAIRASGGGAYTEEELLLGFEQIADERMAGAIRKISVARGFAPSDYALLAFGGAGGMHACRIAEMLHMGTVLLPYDGGLLSAWGIGHARVERFVLRQVLKPLSGNEDAIRRLVVLMGEEAMGSLRKEGYADAELVLVHRLVSLRLAGQESTLELGWDGEESLAEVFRHQYEAMFGYYPEGKAIEVESIRVVAGTVMGSSEGHRVAARRERAHAGRVRWDDLAVGEVLAGPLVLMGQHATAWVADGWELVVGEAMDIALQRVKEVEEAEAHGEAIALELFTNRFMSIAEEMGAQLQRTAFSVNVKERLDFSCALLDPSATLLVNAPHIPVHLGSLGVCARLILEHLPLGPGDVVITNHPRYGGSHLPDVTLLSGVFSDEGEVLGYVINRAHHAEIGGKRPGSMPPDARTLSEEGVVIVPRYLVRAGEMRWSELEALFTMGPWPTRSLAENMADINAALASLRRGEQALRGLAKRYGTARVLQYMGALTDVAAEALTEALAAFPEGKYDAEEYLDDGSRIAVAMRVSAGGIDMVFEGSPEVHPGNLNANISIVYSVVLYVMRLMLRREIPLNEGLLRKVQIRLPERSLLHPHFEDAGEACPAVVGGNTELSQRLTDTMLKALGLAACSQGTMNNFLFGDARFGYYETIGGGAGAGDGFAGRSAVHQHMTNTRITDPEELEFRYPVRLRRFAIRRGSGGEGRWPGGDGIIREFEFLAPVEMTILAEHRRVAPYGMAGGGAGQLGQQWVIYADGREEALGGMLSRPLGPGDRLVIATPGGGAWGRK